MTEINDNRAGLAGELLEARERIDTLTVALGVWSKACATYSKRVVELEAERDIWCREATERKLDMIDNSIQIEGIMNELRTARERIAELEDFIRNRIDVHEGRLTPDEWVLVDSLQRDQT